MIFDKIKVILVEQLNCNDDDISLTTNIIDDLGATSLDIAELVMTLEEDLDIRIEDDDIEQLVSIGDIVHYIEDRM